jgi:hypothetical protein
MPGPYRVLITNTSQSSWKYQVFDFNGKLGANGTAQTEAEAKTLAEKKKAELELSD